MPFEITRSDEHDRAAILELFAEARGNDLSDEERSRRGFVQGRMDETMLARLQADIGVYVARDGSQIAGLCVASSPGTVQEGPPAEMVKAMHAARPAQPLEKTFLYGPVAVARRYQGKGVLSLLLTHLCAELRGRYELGVTFVEAANHKSLAVHRHFGMKETTTFLFQGRTYIVFTFSPGELACRNAHNL